MAAVLTKQTVQFHGVWLARHMVSGNLVRSIGQEYSSKPARDAHLTLTPAEITLHVLPTANGKQGRVEKIAFAALRDVSFNQYDSRCLMVVYVDTRHMLSIMVCSSRDERAVLELIREFKDHKDRPLLKQRAECGTSSPAETGMNWTLHHSERQLRAGLDRFVDGQGQGYVVKLDSGVVSNSGRINSDGADCVFSMDDEYEVLNENEALERERVRGDGGADAFNVGVQTQVVDFGSDTDSLVSSNSIQSLRDDLYTLSEEMKAIKFLLEKSTGISAEEYYRRRDTVGNRHAVAFHTKQDVFFNGDSQHPEADRSTSANLEKSISVSSSTNGDKGRFVVDLKGKTKVTQQKDTYPTNPTPHTTHPRPPGESVTTLTQLNPADDDDDYDLRSVAMQTDRRGQLGNTTVKPRYLKRATIGFNTANVYRERSASSQKRSNGSSSSMASGRNSQGGSLRGPNPSGNGGHGHQQQPQQQHYGVTGDHQSSKNMFGTSTVTSRPIESVYQNSYRNAPTRGFNNRRKKLVIVTPSTSPSAIGSASLVGK